MSETIREPTNPHVVGRVTPCAPQCDHSHPNGAHGVTHPTASGVSRAVLTFLLLAIGPALASALDLRTAVVVSSPNLSSPEKKAVTMLVEEVEKRTHVLWPATTMWPSSNAPVILVGNRSALEGFAGPHTKELPSLRGASGPEGYQVSVASNGKEAFTALKLGRPHHMLFGATKIGS